MNQLGEQEAKILAYTLAVKKLEAQIVTFQKQQLSLNEQLTFQANEIYAKDEKLKRYRRIGMKVVKEKEQLQKNSRNHGKFHLKTFWKLFDSGPQKPEISDSDDNSTEHFYPVNQMTVKDLKKSPQSTLLVPESKVINLPNEMVCVN
ncbi:hypothetical protein Tco_1575951 [Tanacetum coccineum]